MLGTDLGRLSRPYALFLLLGSLLGGKKFVIVRCSVGVVLAVANNGAVPFLYQLQPYVFAVQCYGRDISSLEFIASWLGSVDADPDVLANQLFT